MAAADTTFRSSTLTMSPCRSLPGTELAHGCADRRPRPDQYALAAIAFHLTMVVWSGQACYGRGEALHASNSSSASANSHRSGSSSGQEMMPTLSLPLSDITVMFSPEPWNIGGRADTSL